MENLETMEFFERSVRTYEKLFRLRPDMLVHDLHPDYLSTRYAKDRASQESLPLLGVQHHHAHAVSCMIDNGITEPVIAVTMDGSGYGLDGRIWGGEWFIADLHGFIRAASLEYLPLLGGDTGTRHPGRVAFAYIRRLFGPNFPLPQTLRLSDAEKEVLTIQIERGVNLNLTSSLGRLFDVVAAVGGGRLEVSYEAQGAIEMEMVCRDCDTSYPYDLRHAGESTGWGETGNLPPYLSLQEIALAPLLRSILRDVRDNRSFPEIGSKFHRSIARMIGEVSHHVSQGTGLTKVALSGGCFQNRILLEQTVEELRKHHLKPLLHCQVPSNDGGISLGQAGIGSFTLK